MHMEEAGSGTLVLYITKGTGTYESMSQTKPCEGSHFVYGKKGRREEGEVQGEEC